MNMPVEWTSETPVDGLRVHQPRRGFRYGSESFWAVGFALEGGEARTAVDLGTGSGIMACLLAARGVDVTAVDCRPEWQEGWELTEAASVMRGRVRWQLCDVLDVRASVDLVVSNPPFFRTRDGPPPADRWKGAARFEGRARVEDFAAVACHCLNPGGRAVLVVPVEREDSVRAGVPRGFGVSRSLVIGRRRLLLELSATPGEEDRGQIEEDGDRVLRWYEQLRRLGG